MPDEQQDTLATLAFARLHAWVFRYSHEHQQILFGMVARALCEREGITLDHLFARFLEECTVESLHNATTRAQEFASFPTEDLSHLRDSA